VNAANFTPFETFPYPVAITDTRDVIVYVNPAFERTYGYEAARVIGLPPHFLLPPDIERAAIRNNLAWLHGGKIWEGVLPNVTATGNLIHLHLIGLPVGARDRQEPFGIVYVGCEVAMKDRMRMEFLELMARNYFSARILPDFRAPSEARRGERGRAVVGLLDLGYTPKQVAAMLGISPSTVGVLKWKAKHHGKKQDSGGQAQG
jgi:PAS domain S-box-containing protein